MTKDINLHESGSGGEISIINNDLVLGEALFQQVYLALFGGNLEASTRGDELITEIRQDWWGNSVFFGENPNKQFNSLTEKALNEVVLNSSGRLTIINAINEDLDYLRSVVNFTIDVIFSDYNTIKIMIKFEQTQTNNDTVLELVWNNAKNELIINRTI